MRRHSLCRGYCSRLERDACRHGASTASRTRRCTTSGTALFAAGPHAGATARGDLVRKAKKSGNWNENGRRHADASTHAPTNELVHSKRIRQAHDSGIIRMIRRDREKTFTSSATAPSAREPRSSNGESGDAKSCLRGWGQGAGAEGGGCS